MKLIITATTDNQFLGHIIDSDDNPIILNNGILIEIEKTLILSDGVRFISSNYIIDTKEI